MRRGKGRGRVWRGIRDWFRPAETPDSNPSSRSLPAAAPTAAASHASVNTSGSVRSTLWSRARLDSVPDSMDGGPGVFDGMTDQAGEAVLEFSGADGADDRELLEFLAADLDPVPADPAFRERLREELWGVVLDDVARRGKA